MQYVSATPQQTSPELPAAYELVFFEKVESIRESARELANQEHDEGLLIWALQQTNSYGRLKKSWVCNDGDLHCSVILRPEFEPKIYYQILLVAIVSLGNSIASHVSAMTALGYNWPNDVSIANHKIASVWLDQGKSAKGDWLTVSLSVNIKDSPQDQLLNAMSIKQSEGTTDLTNKDLLEAFAREFIKQLNNWADRGFDYIYKQWKVRLQNIDTQVEIQSSKGIHCGIIKGVDAEGNIQLKTTDDVTKITISDYMELGQC